MSQFNLSLSLITAGLLSACTGGNKSPEAPPAQAPKKAAQEATAPAPGTAQIKLIKLAEMLTVEIFIPEDVVAVPLKADKSPELAKLKDALPGLLLFKTAKKIEAKDVLTTPDKACQYTLETFKTHEASAPGKAFLEIEIDFICGSPASEIESSPLFKFFGERLKSVALDLSSEDKSQTTTLDAKSSKLSL